MSIPKDALQNDIIIDGYVGIKLAEGEIVRCPDGFLTSPFPKIDLTSNRKASNTLKRVDEWLMRNAYNKASFNKDEYNMINFMSTKNITQSDKNCAELYLFG